MSIEQLQALRADIDFIDGQWVELLARRFQVTAQVGELKKAHALPAVDPAREGEQAARLRALAGQHGLDEAVVLGIHRVILDAVVENHRHLATDR